MNNGYSSIGCVIDGTSEIARDRRREELPDPHRDADLDLCPAPAATGTPRIDHAPHEKLRELDSRLTEGLERHPADDDESRDDAEHARPRGPCQLGSPAGTPGAKDRRSARRPDAAVPAQGGCRVAVAGSGDRARSAGGEIDGPEVEPSTRGWSVVLVVHAGISPVKPKLVGGTIASGEATVQ